MAGIHTPSAHSIGTRTLFFSATTANYEHNAFQTRFPCYSSSLFPVPCILLPLWLRTSKQQCRLSRVHHTDDGQLEDLPLQFHKFANNYDVTDFVTASSSVNSTNVFLPVEKDPVVQTFQLQVHGTFCHPAHIAAGQESTVIVATHGIGGDGSYWNSPYKPEKYNFVNAAAKQGYSVFYYDRIGNGKSTKLSGYVNQLSLQVDVLSNLVKGVKAGTYTGSLGVPSKVVVLGFSFGSFVTTTLVATQPTIMDGAIFTGLGYGPTAFAPFFEAYSSRIAATQNSAKFGELDTGVMTWVDVLANINAYFKQPNYEVDVAEYSEIVKQPYTVGEILSLQLGLGIVADAGNFTGPVLVVTGEYDFFACAGYCPGFLDGNLTPLYSGAKNLEIAIHPDSGHSINYNKNATGAFNVITNFLQSNAF